MVQSALGDSITLLSTLAVTLIDPKTCEKIEQLKSNIIILRKTEYMM